jgi:branched-chain amino acid transport system ATP-binding protein
MTDMATTESPDTDRQGEPLLRIDGVTKRFGGLTAVDSVDITVEAGEILGIIGPNGAGKTTLFNCINGFLEPEEGSIVLKGTDVTTAKPSGHAKLGMARTFQLVKTFDRMSVVENVMVGSFLHHGNPTEARDHARNILDEQGLGHLANVEAESLTVAEKKRMELARALAIEPDVLLVDEVMAGLQEDEVAEIMANLRRINQKGTTVILIEHVMDAIMGVSDRIVVLNEGRRIASGTPEEIADNDEVIEAYLGQRWREQREQAEREMQEFEWQTEGGEDDA